MAANDDSAEALRRQRDDLQRQGVLFVDLPTARRDHPEIVERYLGTVIPIDAREFAAVDTADGLGGWLIYVPPGVEVAMPLQAYHDADVASRGQFERTLIVASEGSEVHYIEGCAAPVYTSDSLRSGVVEVVVGPSAHVTHTTMQNWSSNVFELSTRRAKVEADGRMEWIDGNFGGRLTMTCPAVWLVGPNATGEVRTVAYAGAGQHHDTGATIVHAAPETSSRIVSRSIAKAGGRATHRGLVRVEDGAHGCESRVQCHALLLDRDSIGVSNSYLEIGAPDTRIERETTVGSVADEQMFYLMSRGLSEAQAIGTVANGFIEPVTRALPVAYAVEWTRLIELRAEGSVG